MDELVCLIARVTALDVTGVCTADWLFFASPQLGVQLTLCHNGTGVCRVNDVTIIICAQELCLLNKSDSVIRGQRTDSNVNDDVIGTQLPNSEM